MHAFMHGACLHFCGRLGTTDLLNKIKINTNLIKLFHFEIYVILLIFKSSVYICNNIWEYHLNKYIYNSSQEKSGANMHVFLYTIVCLNEKILNSICSFLYSTSTILIELCHLILSSVENKVCSLFI